jgi:hypothetical protein
MMYSVFADKMPYFSGKSGGSGLLQGCGGVGATGRSQMWTLRLLDFGPEEGTRRVASESK